MRNRVGERTQVTGLSPAEETGKKARKENGRKDGIVKGRLARDVQLNLLNSQIKKTREHTQTEARPAL